MFPHWIPQDCFSYFPPHMLLKLTILRLPAEPSFFSLFPTPPFLFFWGGEEESHSYVRHFSVLHNLPCQLTISKNIRKTNVYFCHFRIMPTFFFFFSHKSHHLLTSGKLVFRSLVSFWIVSDLPQHLWGRSLMSSSKKSWRLPLKTRERRQTGEQHSRDMESLTKLLPFASTSLVSD